MGIPIRDDPEEHVIVEEGGEVWVWIVGTYPPFSILAGQPMAVRIARCASVEEARRAFPFARVSTDRPSRPRRGPTPPRDFDPGDAGERW